ncbi:MAG: hypothetical protein ACEQSX_17070 [Baekduiaceae bacterium]
MGQYPGRLGMLRQGGWHLTGGGVFAPRGGTILPSGGYAPGASSGGSPPPTYYPWDETDSVGWWSSKYEALLAASPPALPAVITTPTDLEGAHTLTQATAGKRMTLTAAALNGNPALVPGAGGVAAHSGYQFSADWAKPAALTVYYLIKYLGSGTYQVAFVGDHTAGTSLGPVGRFSHNAGNANKASLASGARVIYTAAMTDGSIHVITYGWNATHMFLRLDGGAVQTDLLDQASPGVFRTGIGFPNLDTQDCICTVEGFGMHSGAWDPGGARDLRVMAYLNALGGL